MRQYMADRYKKRRNEIILRLGGTCVVCGGSGPFEIDHVDPRSKNFDFGRRLAGVAQEKLTKELDKAQLLCEDCHHTKTILDHGKVPAKGTHGTLSAYRYCRCKKCKQAKSEHNKTYTSPRSKGGQCIDCNKVIDRRSKRCKSCSTKYRYSNSASLA